MARRPHGWTETRICPWCHEPLVVDASRPNQRYHGKPKWCSNKAKVITLPPDFYVRLGRLAASGGKYTKPRGLAAASPETRRRVTALGIAKIKALGLGHRYTSAEAKRAGRKGGRESARRRRERRAAAPPVRVVPPPRERRVGYRFTSTEAVLAGSKGGRESQRRWRERAMAAGSGT